jgi:DNA-binding transcriptional ArsR family regulator
MPVAFEESASTGPELRTSAAAELVWALLWLQHGPPHRQPAAMERFLPFPEDLAERVETFWADGCYVFSELVVLAHASGHLYDSDPGAFFDDLGRRVPKLGELRLRSETDADRAVILERLRRLRADAQLRRRYVQLLREAWSLVGSTWRRHGVPALEAGGRQLRDRLERAADPADVVPKLGKARPALVELFREEYRRGDAVICPCYFGGWYLVLDLPGLLFVTTQLDPDWRDENRRESMGPLATQVRVLADPTRLAILAHLAEGPQNVTELMRLLRLAQPTVSTHLRLLREAGFVRPRRSAGRTEYTVDRDRLDQVLKSVADAIPSG